MYFVYSDFVIPILFGLLKGQFCSPERIERVASLETIYSCEEHANSYVHSCIESSASHLS